MFFLIYKITNLTTNKIYIGKHQTVDINDSYFGSGKILKRAIKKYGIENFSKDILFVFKTEEEMDAKEKELVTEEFCLLDSTYNLCVGGQGGFSYINREGFNHPNFIQGEQHAKNCAIKANQKIKELRKNPEWRAQHLANISAAQKLRHETIPGNFTGKVHNEETKRIMSEKAKSRPNNKLGKRWVTHPKYGTKLIDEKELDSYIESGYHRGKK